MLNALSLPYAFSGRDRELLAAWSIWIPGTRNGPRDTGRIRCRTAYAILVMTHGPGTLTGRTPVTVKVLPSGLVTLNVFALTCRTTEPEP